MADPSASASHSKAVRFQSTPTFSFIEPRSIRIPATMGSLVYKCYDGRDVTDAMLEAAAKLFNNNYGIWDERLGRKGPVKLSARRLRESYLPQSATTVYASVTSDGTLAGNVFACRWQHGDKMVCWVTQLVVARDFRERGIASTLLRHIRQDDDSIYGLMSSHPAAILASAKAFARPFAALDLEFMRTEAAAAMKESPISYVRDAKLSGSLFFADDTSGMIAGVDTQFFVDHTEPSEALTIVKEQGIWPLGDLLDGHEFIIVLQAQHRRSRSRSLSRTRDSTARPGTDGHEDS